MLKRLRLTLKKNVPVNCCANWDKNSYSFALRQRHIITLQKGFVHFLSYIKIRFITCGFKFLIAFFVQSWCALLDKALKTMQVAHLKYKEWHSSHMCFCGNFFVDEWRNCNSKKIHVLSTSASDWHMRFVCWKQRKRRRMY